MGTQRAVLAGAFSVAGAWAAFCAVYAIFGLASMYGAVSTPCVLPDCPPPRVTDASFSLPIYALAVVALASIIVAAFFALAVIVGLRTRRVRTIAVAAVFATLAASSVTAGPRDGFAAVVWVVGTSGLFWLLAVYPTVSFRPRWAVVPVAVAGGWSIVIAVLSRGTSSEPWWWLEGLVFTVALAAILVAQIVRYMSGSIPERRQLRLLLLVLGALVLTSIAWAAGSSANPSWGAGSVPAAIASEWAGVLLLIAATCVAWAVARESALGIIVDRAIVGALLSSVFVACYALVVAAVGALVSDGVPTVAAAFGAAILFAALARPITRHVESLTFGDDEAPDAIARLLSERLASADSDEPVLPSLLVVACERLHLESVELDPPTGTVRVARTEAVDVEVSGVSHTVWARPHQGQRLTARTRRALAAAAGPLVAASLLDARTSDLRASRLSLATMREEERQELRRHLHDDVVPSLAATRHRITAATGAAGNAQAAHLAAAVGSVDDAIEALRSLARTMRPPELDALGLVPALRLFASRMSIPVVISGNNDVLLPGTVESTIYRIAVEALLNTERHAQATAAEVRLVAASDSVALSIADDGIGGADELAWGVGLVSIRERVSELGGRLDVSDNDPRGLRVDCTLPVGARP